MKWWQRSLVVNIVRQLFSRPKSVSFGKSNVRQFHLAEELERCAREHGDLARAYERSKNTAGAMELRRVENLLWALRRGEPWSTVLPHTDTDRT